jgi:hypothetical protein
LSAIVDTSERELEAGERPHHNGVDVLGVEPGIAKQARVGLVHERSQALANLAVVLGRVERLIERPGGRVVIDHVDPVSCAMIVSWRVR